MTVGACSQRPHQGRCHIALCLKTKVTMATVKRKSIKVNSQLNQCCWVSDNRTDMVAMLASS